MNHQAEYQALKQRLASLEALLRDARTREKRVDQLVDHIAGETDFERVIERVAQYARELVQADTVLIPLIDEGGQSYTYQAATGKLADEILGDSMPMQVGMCGWVLRNRQSLLFGESQQVAMEDLSRWEAGMESALLVPLKSRGRYIGGISALGKAGGGSFTEADQALLELFANHVSLIIDRSNVYRQLEEQK